MLACEFNYSREYVDTYINMPALRALNKYRTHNPPIGTLIKAIFSDKKQDDTEVTNKTKVANLASMEGMNIQKMPKELFDVEMAIMNAPSNY